MKKNTVHEMNYGRLCRLREKLYFWVLIAVLDFEIKKGRKLCPDLSRFEV